jgi:hypothetical protein
MAVAYGDVKIITSRKIASSLYTTNNQVRDKSLMGFFEVGQNPAIGSCLGAGALKAE